MELNYVCADCGHHQDAMDRLCDTCGSYRVILVSVAIENFGPNYRDCFEPLKAIIGPVITKSSFEQMLEAVEPSPGILKLRAWWQAELEKGIQDFHISCKPGFEASDFEAFADEMNQINDAIERGDTKPFEDI